MKNGITITAKTERKDIHDKFKVCVLDTLGSKGRSRLDFSIVFPLLMSLNEPLFSSGMLRIETLNE